MSQNSKANQTFNNRRQTNTVRANQNTGGKIRLRRSNWTKQAVIEENLTHMEQQAHKKRLAQELYYNNQAGQSPLTRISGESELDHKAPVRNRLGNKIRLHRNVNQYTNQNLNKRVNQNLIQNANRPNNQQKIRLRRPPQQSQQFRLQPLGQQVLMQRRNDNFIRVNAAQNRLFRIKQGGLVYRNSGTPGVGQRGIGFIQRGGVQQRGVVQRAFRQPGALQPNAGQKIRLRRNRPHSNMQSGLNYTVQVANSISNKHGLNTMLNPYLQEEIKIIQSRNVGQGVSTSASPLHVTGPGCTNRSLHQRFSEL